MMKLHSPHPTEIYQFMKVHNLTYGQAKYCIRHGIVYGAVKLDQYNQSDLKQWAKTEGTVKVFPVPWFTNKVMCDSLQTATMIKLRYG